MPNVTITSDANHDDLTTRGAGQNITINSGAVLTIDSYPQETAMGLLGQIVTNDGIWRVDGRQVKEFVYTSGTGSLPAIGDIITDSGGASGKVIYLNSGTAASGVMTVTQQSGTFTAANTLTSGGFSATLSTVKVGYLQFFMEDGNNTGKGLGSLEFLGEWYDLGTGDGTDNQTFTLPHNGTQMGIWVETGSGTGVYERWFRKESSTAFTDYQTDELGKCFDHTINSNTVTFGTSTNGNTPPSGARLLIPNVHIGTATLADPKTEVAADIAGNSMWNVGVNASLSLSIDKVNFSTLNTTFTGLDSISITDSCVAVTSSQLSNLTVNETTIDNSVILGSGDLNGSEGRNMSFTDVSGVTITDSILGAYMDFPVNFTTSSNITLSNMVLTGMDPTHSNNNRRVKFSNCSGVVANNVTGLRVELLFEIGTSNVRWNNYRYSDGESSVLSSANGSGVFFMQSGANDIVVDGFTLIPNGSMPRNDFAEFVDSINCIVRNAGSINSKIDCQNQTDFLASFAGVSSGCKLQRVFLTNTRNARMCSYVATTINCEVTNCSSGYDRGQIPDSKNTLLQGAHGGNGALNTSQGLEIDYPLTAGVHGLDMLTSDTTGRIHVIFAPPSAETTQYVSLTGGAVYNKEGDLLLRSTGDSAEIEIPYFIKGHDSFVNVDPTINGNFVQATDVSYTIDTGSGYGAYKAATGANLSGETINSSGFRIKFKFESPTDNASRLVNGFFVETTTTLSSQSDNFYPFASPLVGFSLTQTGSNLAAYDETSEELLAVGAENGSGVSAVEIPWEANFNAILRLRKAGFEGVENLTPIVEAGGISPGIQSEYSLIAGLGDPNLTSNLTITNHGASPVSFDAGNGAKDYSITIQTDSTGDSFTATQLLNEINYSVAQTDTYFGFSGLTWPEMVVQAGTNVETARGVLFGSTGATQKGVRVIKSDGNAHPAISRHQADDGTYGQAPTSATVSITNIEAGSRLRIYNETQATEVVNQIVSGTSYSASYTDGTDYAAGDVIQVRLAYQSGTSAKLGFTAAAVASSSGWAVLADQKDDTIYSQIGLDGSLITKFDADYLVGEVDIVTAVNFLGHELYARFVYFITTEDGIRSFFGALTAIDIANFINDVTILDLYLNNNTSTNLLQTDNVRLFKSNGVYPVRNPTTGGGGIDVVWRDKIFVAETGGSSLTPAQAATLSNILDNTDRVDDLIEDDGSGNDRFTSKALEQGGGGGGGSSDWTSGEKEQIRDALGVDGDKTEAINGQLQDKSEFDHSQDEVITDSSSRIASQANVSSLATQSSVDDLPSASEIYTEFTSGNNEDAFKADVSNLSADVNVVAVDGSPITSIDDFKADISSLASQASVDSLPSASQNSAAVWDAQRSNHTVVGSYGATVEWASSGGTTPSDVYTYFTDSNREDVFKADLSSGTFDANIIKVNGDDINSVDDFKSEAEWSTAEKEQIRDALGVDGDKTEAINGQLQEKSEFDHSQDEVTTDSPSRIASQADVSSLATQSSVNNLPSASEIYTEFTSGNNEDAFKADVSNLSADVNVVAVDGSPITSIDDFKADISSLASQASVDSLPSASQNSAAVWDAQRSNHTTTGSYGATIEWVSSGGATPSDVYNYFTDSNREDAFKADLSGGNFDVNITKVNGSTINSVDDFKSEAEWSTTEKEQIRDALGIDGDKTEATDGQLQDKSEFDHSQDEVTTDSASRIASQADVSSLASQESVDEIPSEVWEIDLSSVNTANSAGKELKNKLNKKNYLPPI